MTTSIPELPLSKDDHRFDNYTEYIDDAWVKYLEAAGARVVPLSPQMAEDELTQLLSKLNGIFFPGSP